MDRKIQIILFFLAFCFDQLTKFYFFDVQKNSLNLGISFGFGEDINRNIWLIIILLILGLVIFIVGQQQLWHWSLVFFLAGAVSNLADRIFFEGVRDWLPVPFFALNNNLADYFIISSLIIFILHKYPAACHEG